MHEISLFKTVLFDSFTEWLEHHKKVIGDTWYSQLTQKTKKAKAECNNALLIMSDAMWIFSMISNFGVHAGLGPAKVLSAEIPKQFDEKLTKRVLINCISCICLQYLPADLAHQQFEGNINLESLSKVK